MKYFLQYDTNMSPLASSSVGGTEVVKKGRFYWPGSKFTLSAWPILQRQEHRKRY
jgi:hypothetical protein